MAATATTGYSEMSLHDYLELPTKVPDLIAMLKMELQTDNVINIAEQKEA